MQSQKPKEGYPLAWPLSQRRTDRGRRQRGRFEVLTERAINDLLDELGRLGASAILISSNVPTRRDGLPRSDHEPADPGVVVYFDRGAGDKRRAFVIACDTYDKVRHNLRAIGATIEAIRTISRHGASELVEQALSGFAELPAHIVAEPSWWDVLGLPHDATIDQAKAARERLALINHPDRGGSVAEMARINRAYDRAVEEITGR